MNSGTFDIKNIGSTKPFDDYFSDTHGGTNKEEDGEIIWDGDVDDCVEPESMDDN